MYDIIFMDVHMPVLDGYQATQRIRAALAKDKQPHIIALTASVMTTDKNLCLDAGMDDFLKKPLELGELSSVLEKFIASRSTGPLPFKATPNCEGILQKFGNDFEVFEAVAKIYLGDYQNRIKSIKDSIDRRDLRALVEATHALKGAANNFSSELVSEVAGRLESLARDGMLEEAGNLFHRLVEEADQLSRDIMAMVMRGGAA